MLTPITDHQNPESRLEGLTLALRNLISKAPSWSRAAAEARHTLDKLEQNRALTTAQKLETVRAAVHRFREASLLTTSHDDPLNFTKR
jgi:hypothetical protein